MRPPQSTCWTLRARCAHMGRSRRTSSGIAALWKAMRATPQMPFDWDHGNDDAYVVALVCVSASGLCGQTGVVVKKKILNFRFVFFRFFSKKQTFFFRIVLFEPCEACDTRLFHNPGRSCKVMRGPSIGETCVALMLRVYLG